MFQDFALFPHLSILANVAFGLKSLPKEDAAARRLRRWPASASSATRTTTPTSSPAASSSAWHWHGPSCRGRP